MARKQPGSKQPYLNHDTMTQAQQSRFLGRSVERTKNLGHDSTVDRLTENPAGMIDYANNDVSKGVVRGPPRSRGVYGKFANPEDGRSTQQNLDRWSDYARSNSYSVDGRGRDPRGRGEGSDNHLRSTKGWARFDSGAESGPGRLEKSGKR